MAADTMIKAETTAGVSDYAHMLLKVSDIARAERFYVDLLGFKIRPAKPLPDGRPFVPFTQGIALTSGGATNSTQINPHALQREDGQAIVARLRAADVKFDRDLHDGIYGLTIYVFDPDGTMIELYEEGQKMP